MLRARGLSGLVAALFLFGFMSTRRAGGVRYNNFHTTALCSPSRGALLNKAHTTLSALGLLTLGGFRAEYFGLEPALPLSSTIAGTDVNFIVKYLFRVVNENRFDGNYMMAGVGLKF